MYVMKLCKGLSFSGFIHATIQNPLVELATEDEADKAVETGYFTLEKHSTDFGKMTVIQLEAYATEQGVDLSGCKNKEDKLDKILSFQNAGGMEITMES